MIVIASIYMHTVSARQVSDREPAVIVGGRQVSAREPLVVGGRHGWSTSALRNRSIMFRVRLAWS